MVVDQNAAALTEFESGGLGQTGLGTDADRGDRDAAAKVDCCYYPILPGEEKRSWGRFKDEALGKFLDGTFRGEYQQMLIDEFNAKLPDQVPWETLSGNRSVSMPQVK